MVLMRRVAVCCILVTSWWTFLRSFWTAVFGGMAALRVGRSFGRRELSARTYDFDELSENLRRHVAMQICDDI